MKIKRTDKHNPLVGMMMQGTSGYIERMEAQGQRELIVSTAIPTKGSEQLESLGFTLGDIHRDDPLFRDCQLPEGWSKEDSGHSMWSYIVDERGFRRVAMFYKAAFYDRRAHLCVERVPYTSAQAAAFEKVQAYVDAQSGRSYRQREPRREGDEYIYVYGQYGDPVPEGHTSWDGDRWRFEIRVAMNGTIVSATQLNAIEHAWPSAEKIAERQRETRETRESNT